MAAWRGWALRRDGATDWGGAVFFVVMYLVMIHLTKVESSEEMLNELSVPALALTVSLPWVSDPA